MDELSKHLAKVKTIGLDTLFLTNDKRLSKLQELIDVLVLDNFVE